MGEASLWPAAYFHELSAQNAPTGMSAPQGGRIFPQNSAVLRVLLAVVPVVNQCDQEADQADDGQS